jgi:uncharacterized C2H2 Zn-finger protein
MAPSLHTPQSTSTSSDSTFLAQNALKVCPSLQTVAYPSCPHRSPKDPATTKALYPPSFDVQDNSSTMTGQAAIISPSESIPPMFDSSSQVKPVVTCGGVRSVATFSAMAGSLTSTDSSVPAACASLLSLKAAGTMSYRTVGSSGIGHLPSLTASVMLEDSSAITTERSRGRAFQGRSHFPLPSPSFSTFIPSMAAPFSCRPQEGTDHKSARGSTVEKTSRGFWDTVLADTQKTATESCSSSDDQQPQLLRTTPRSADHPVSQEGEQRASKPFQGEFPPMAVPTPRIRHLAGEQFPRGSDSEESLDCYEHAKYGDHAENQMNIPCLLCGVRFRKPGHLNMHWRSVHATDVNSSYPGSYASDMVPARDADDLSIAAGCPKGMERRITHRSTAATTTALAVADSRGRITRTNHAYGCPQCDARFRRGSDRNRHMRMVHERRRPFACDRCPKQFGRKSFLQAHVLTVHEKRRPFACDHCGAAFGQRSSLTRHAKKIHGVGM